MTTRPGAHGTLITVAPTGAELDKADVPNLPVTLDELVTTARDCERVGASMIHVHIRGAVTDPEEDRLRVLDAMPDSASCTMGTVNFGDDVFMNRWEFVVEMHKRMRE